MDELNEAELERFLRNIQTPTLHFAVLRIGNEADALDALQDAMIGFVKVADQYESAAWQNLFYKILIRRIRDMQRKRGWRQKLMHIISPSSLETDNDEHSSNPAEGVDREDAGSVLHGEQLGEAFEQCLADLPPRQQEAYLLRQWQGRSVKEAAAIMACSEGSVKTHLSRAMQTLKQSLGDWMDEDDNEST